MIATIVILSLLLLIALVAIVFLIRSVRMRDEYIYETEEEYEQLEADLESETKECEQLKSKIASTKCILCDEPSNGKHYCYSCYTKYKERAIDVRLKNCSSSEILDYYGNKTFVCDDETKVRSRAEALISNFLYNNRIRYIYEKSVHYVENDATKTLHPDFYLPDYNLYIEYNELETESYLRSKEYAMRIYRQKGMNVIVMTNKDLYDIAAFLSPKLNIN